MLKQWPGQMLEDALGFVGCSLSAFAKAYSVFACREHAHAVTCNNLYSLTTRVTCKLGSKVFTTREMILLIVFIQIFWLVKLPRVALR